MTTISYLQIQIFKLLAIITHITELVAVQLVVFLFSPTKMRDVRFFYIFLYISKININTS